MDQGQQQAYELVESLNYYKRKQWLLGLLDGRSLSKPCCEYERDVLSMHVPATTSQWQLALELTQLQGLLGWGRGIIYIYIYCMAREIQGYLYYCTQICSGPQEK